MLQECTTVSSTCLCLLDLVFVNSFFCPTADDFLGDSGTLFDSTHNGNTDEDQALEEGPATVPFGQDLNVDELLADRSVMFPILSPILDDNDSVGDVNDLFGELELLLAVSAFFCFFIFPLNWPLVPRSMWPPCF